jgi:hypothetical protein
MSQPREAGADLPLSNEISTGSEIRFNGAGPAQSTTGAAVFTFALAKANIGRVAYGRERVRRCKGLRVRRRGTRTGQ